MYRRGDALIRSATDVVNHLACEHLTQLERRHLDTPLDPNGPDPSLALLQGKGQEWERAYLAELRARHGDVVEISPHLNHEEAAAATRAALARGAPVVYQATLAHEHWYGKADFLRRVERPSSLGAFSYEVLDTKLSRHPKPSHVLQLCHYNWLLGVLQGVESPLMHVVLGDRREVAFRYADYSRYFHRLRVRFAEALETRPPTYPHPTDKCAECRWSTRCDREREAADHLWGVANISRQQIRRLEDAGLSTLAALAAAETKPEALRMNPATFEKLRRQARSHLKGRELGKPWYELRADVEQTRGFARLPPPDAGDLYFDMEGDPYYDGGLEYLFGVTWREDGELRFRAFWAHDRAEEKRAFEAFVDFVMERRRQYPDLHVYHYADYERRALETLMQAHDTREHEVDTLFRERRLVDLYRVVQESLVASTPSYSIKDIERFYRPKRSGEVTNAGASIVEYEKWRELRTPSILDDIERYNRDDCESTAQLHAWLLGMRPAELAFRAVGQTNAPDAPPKPPGDPADPMTVAAEQQRREREALKASLAQGLPAEYVEMTAPQRAAHLTAQLLDFHRREDKPSWWKLYWCQEASQDELVHDVESLAGLTRVGVVPGEGRRLGGSIYTYPEQESKVRAGADYTRVDTLKSVEVLSLDPQARRIVLKETRAGLPATLSLGPPRPIGTDLLRETVARYAAAAACGANPYRALSDYLRREAPRLAGRAPGARLCASDPPTTEEVIDAVAALDESYLFVQGPPGAGKTYTGSHVIVELLRRGRRVGVSSNSHKAITNLLQAVDEVAAQRDVRFRGVQKVSDDDDEPSPYRQIELEQKPEDVEASGADLVAGTAWLFARPAFDRAFDYLFVDEAGQVSIANLVAMGVAAKNLVLLGDQMQLGQPIQAHHPEPSGESVLDYLLEGQPVIEPHRGVFLAQTWRMHPELCRFVSDAVYDGQLKSAPGRDRQALLLDGTAPFSLAPVGLRFHPVEHDGCTQASEEEAAVVRLLFDYLLTQCWRDCRDRVAPLALDDVLVVAPYNLQVNLLKDRLPPGARVGTVDKFQGQEAPVVIVSLATSSGDDLPRDIEFLYSKNRLNVALSRAKCLSVVVASPKLLDVRCRTVEQIALVNTLCWVEEYGRAQRREVGLHAVGE